MIGQESPASYQVGDEVCTTRAFRMLCPDGVLTLPCGTRGEVLDIPDENAYDVAFDDEHTQLRVGRNDLTPST